MTEDSSMEDQVLETVEENSDETPVLERIEEVVPPEPITRKDPKRVEQGKRLAQISLEAKRKKMREQIEKENFSYMTSYGYPLITFASVMVVAWTMFFGNSMVRPEDVVLPPDLEPVVTKSSKNRKGDRSCKFESLG